MKKLLETKQLTKNMITGPVQVKAELFKHSTYYSIRVEQPGRTYPLVKVGQEAYIMKQWKGL